MAVGVVVVIYTAYGGLRTSIYTDRIQFLVLTPVVLLLVIVAAVMVGGKADIWRNAGEAGLMSFSAPDGYRFAIVLIIGIVASNAFHPGMWQRVYTIESQRSLNRTLWAAVAIAIPLTFIMGWPASPRWATARWPPSSTPTWRLRFSPWPTWAAEWSRRRRSTISRY